MTNAHFHSLSVAARPVRLFRSRTWEPASESQVCDFLVGDHDARLPRASALFGCELDEKVREGTPTAAANRRPRSQCYNLQHGEGTRTTQFLLRTRAHSLPALPWPRLRNAPGSTTTSRSRVHGQHRSAQREERRG